jgi:hypothetical protein
MGGGGCTPKAKRAGNARIRMPFGTTAGVGLNLGM